MINNRLKMALAAMGVVCQDDELSEVVDVLKKEYGITFYKLEVPPPDIKEVIKQMSESVDDDKILFEPISKKQPKRKWNVPKKIGKPQKRKGRF